MPVHHLRNYELEINREAVLLDTNILVAYHDPKDCFHEHAQAFLSVWEGQLIVFFAVVIEAWGVLAGKRRREQYAYEMLDWLARPETGIELIPEYIDPFSTVAHMASRYRVDCVDALLVEFADRFSRLHDFRPPLQIASLDSDYITRFYLGEYRIRLLDPKTLDSYP